MFEEAKSKGNAVFSAGDYVAAVKHFTDAIPLSPTQPMFLLNVKFGGPNSGDDMEIPEETSTPQSSASKRKEDKKMEEKVVEPEPMKITEEATRRRTSVRPSFDADNEFMTWLHGSDPVKVELNRLENEVRDKDRELGEAQAEIKALRFSKRLREKAVEELTDELSKVDEKLKLMESLLENKGDYIQAFKSSGSLGERQTGRNEKQMGHGYPFNSGMSHEHPFNSGCTQPGTKMLRNY